MKANRFRNLMVLAIIAFAAFAYYDPLKPTDDEARTAILAGLLASSDDEVSALEVGRSFTGRRMEDGYKTRLWPVHATVKIGSQELPDHDFYVLKGPKGGWTAEVNDPKDKHWDNAGFFGVNRFGM